MKKATIFPLIMTILLFASCRSSDAPSDSSEDPGQVSETEIAEAEDDFFDLFEESDAENTTILGSINYGIEDDKVTDGQLDESDLFEFEYTGGEIRIPMFAQGSPDGVSAAYGLLLFTDGIRQPYSVETADGEKLSEQYMHILETATEAPLEFDIVFTPVAGKAGTQVGLYIATVFNPDCELDGESRNPLIDFFSFSTLLPQHLMMQTDSAYEHTIFTAVSSYEMPDSLKDQYSMGNSDDVYDEEDTALVIAVTDYDDIIAEDGTAEIYIEWYGGKEISYYTTLYINNEPVKVDGYDVIETTIEKGQVARAEFTLDTSAYDEINVLYAVAVPNGLDYLDYAFEPQMSPAVYLFNQ